MTRTTANHSASSVQQMAAIPAAYVSSLVRVAVLSRLVLLLLAITCYHLLPSYDHSTELFFPPTCNSVSDRLVLATLSPLLRWDALHFLGIARDGYVVEKEHAFFPLLPATLSVMATPPAALLNLCPSTALLLSSFILNCLLLPLSIPPLYRLTLLLSSSPSLSYLSCALWLLCPSAIFQLTGGYTELLYACCVFWGLWLCATDRVLLSSCVLCLAAWTRSNGVLLLIFPVVRCSEGLYRMWRSSSEWRDALRSMVAWLATLAACTLLIVSPASLFAYIASRAYCTPPPLPSPTHALPSYCSTWLPSMYAYVQSTYWNVGPFHYWTLQQLPNFLLATPILTTATAALWWTVRQGGRYREYGAHLLLSLCVCVVVLHVQVSTRYLSSVPLLYWYMAWCWQRSEKHAQWLLSWCATYALVGAVLFSLFLPWT